MLFKIKSRMGGLVKCNVKIFCVPGTSKNTKLGKAVITALSNRANLSGANLSGANLSGANLSDADLRGANLRGANLYGADLRDADLRRARLHGANLYGADLYGADLRDADLRRANLRGANLRGANLYGADLRDADLSGANLSGADLGGAVSKVKNLVTSVLRSDGYAFIGFIKADDSLGIAAGCQNQTLGAYRERVATEYPERGASSQLIAETTDILDFLERRHAAMVNQ